MDHQTTLRMETNNVKAKFDKKKWREKKYNKGFRVNKWEENRQKILISKYHRELKKSNITPTNGPKVDKTRPNRISGIKAAQLEYQKIKQEKAKKKEEKLRILKDKEEAMQRYKKKRTENYKKLSRKTKKGQPLMKGRLELMLEKIKQSV